jgi:hypothetical protein
MSKIADEMAETGYLAYRIKKKNNIKPRHIKKSDNKDRRKKDEDQKLQQLMELYGTKPKDKRKALAVGVRRHQLPVIFGEVVILSQ